jgi:glutaredoxin-related protein
VNNITRTENDVIRRCGFSRKVVEALQGDGLEFGSFDILQVVFRSGFWGGFWGG